MEHRENIGNCTRTLESPARSKLNHSEFVLELVICSWATELPLCNSHLNYFVQFHQIPYAISCTVCLGGGGVPHYIVRDWPVTHYIRKAGPKSQSSCLPAPILGLQNASPHLV